MLVPSVLYGDYKTVKTRSRRIVTALARLHTWNDAVGAGDVMDSSKVAGLFVLHGPSPLLQGQPNFQCFVPHSVIRDAYLDKKLDSDTERRVFEDSLQTPWGVLGLLSEHAQGFLYNKERHLPFLNAVLSFWELFRAQGARYTDGRDSGIDIWSAQATLTYVLVNLGVPAAVVKEFNPAKDHFHSLLTHITRD